MVRVRWQKDCRKDTLIVNMFGFNLLVKHIDFFWTVRHVYILLIAHLHQPTAQCHTSLALPVQVESSDSTIQAGRQNHVTGRSEVGVSNCPCVLVKCHVTETCLCAPHLHFTIIST